MSGDLTTLATAKEWLQQSNVTANDAMISRLISAASEFMQNTLMSRDIAIANYAETRNGMGMDRMMLMAFPIVSVASLVIDGVPIPARSNPPYNGYAFDNTMLYLSGYRFCKGVQNVNVSYTAGYASTPFDLEQACLDLIGGWFKYRDRIGKDSEGIEGQTISFSAREVAKLDFNVINGYRRVAPIY